MLDIQKQFVKFHDLIKLDFDSNKPLREKRDLLLEDLRLGLKKMFPENTPTFDPFNQGSYDIGTGIEPIDEGDYDIDLCTGQKREGFFVKPCLYWKICQDVCKLFKPFSKDTFGKAAMLFGDDFFLRDKNFSIKKTPAQSEAE